MLEALLAIIIGTIVLVWSAERFVIGASAAAYHGNVPPLLIGMLIIGFGTSMPELVVSATASLNGNSDLALGNAIGSNIVNIGLILGLTALLSPIMVASNIVRRELPVLLLISVVFGLLLWDLRLSRLDAFALLMCFVCLVAWSILAAFKQRKDALGLDVSTQLSNQEMSFKQSLGWMAVGLVILIISSRVLVWGAVNLATIFGVSDLIIGLTIVAFGTSFPELATSIIAIRRGEHDLAIGNVVGSNMFNLLVVVGVAGMIQPMTSIAHSVLLRDISAMIIVTFILLLMAYGYKRQGRINRLEGATLLCIYIAYTFYLVGGPAIT